MGFVRAAGRVLGLLGRSGWPCALVGAATLACATDGPDGSGSTVLATDATSGTTTGSTGEMSTDEDEGSSGETTSTSGDEPACALPAGSPPAVEQDGELRVPIDIITMTASIVFDVGTQSATASAEIAFVLGPEAGMPIFDLRQTITGLELDGSALDPSAAGYFNPTERNAERMRALAMPLEACSEHTLRVTYDFATPDAPCEEFPEYGAGSVVWFDFNNDLRPGCYAEQWVPSNLPHDEFSGEVEIDVLGTGTPHAVITNGAVENIDANHWTIAFPPTFTSMSLLMIVLPADDIETSSMPLQLPDGHTITLDVVRTRANPEELVDIEALTAESLRSTNLELGEYTHGDRYLVFVSEYEQDMEYDGATSTGFEAIPHEVFHSWVGRGLRPLTTRDSWFDEAWTTFYNEDEFDESLLTPQSARYALAPDNPWRRRTDNEAYDTGSEIWATLADELGLEALRGLARDFYVQHAGEFVTTEQLEQFFFCETNAPVVRFLFHRFVYGRGGDVPDPVAEYCGG